MVRITGTLWLCCWEIIGHLHVFGCVCEMNWWPFLTNAMRFPPSNYLIQWKFWLIAWKTLTLLPCLALEREWWEEKFQTIRACCVFFNWSHTHKTRRAQSASSSVCVVVWVRLPAVNPFCARFMSHCYGLHHSLIP